MNTKKTILILWFCAISVFAFAQQLKQLVGSAGGQNSDNYQGDKRQGYVMDWVVGEFVSETFIASKKILTQGVLQGEFVEIDTLRLDPIMPDGFLCVDIYPNPVSSYLNLDFKTHIQSGQFLIEIFDLQSRKLYHLPVFNPVGSIAIDMRKYKEGGYILKISSIAHHKFKGYQIVKI